MTAADRPSVCCGVCPPIAGGGYDCTCEGNPRCSETTTGWGGYRVKWAAGRAKTTTGAIARGEALAAGDLDWMNVTRRSQDETTTEDAAQVIESTRHYNGSRSFIVPADAARALMDAGLLASSSPARTRPTEPETRTTTEWGVRGYRNSDRTVFFSGEDSARYEARTHGGAVIRQQVTTWPEGE